MEKKKRRENIRKLIKPYAQISKTYFFKRFDWICMIFDQHLAIYSVFYKESESGVEQSKIFDPGGEKLEKPT